ncbi:hypothetical protein MNV49_003576 [Pseudohyphozyma bogoriensis]|nr:hypothetical protein MNV49_003576 [Pseudohyphozyma bogoriensis]
MPRAAKTKSSSKSARKPLPEALSSKMIKLFSEEVEFLLAPPPAIKGRIETLYSSERRITTEDGTIHDEAVRLCSADGAMWITRVKGDPQFFKRLEEKNAFKQIKDADDVGRKSVSKAKSKTRASKKRNNDEEEFGVPDIFEKTSTARQKYASAPGAVPARDHKKDQKWEDDEELRERVREALNRKEFGTEEERIGFDDLASLCERVEGLDVRSALDVDGGEREETPPPVASSSRTLRSASRRPE